MPVTPNEALTKVLEIGGQVSVIESLLPQVQSIQIRDQINFCLIQIKQKISEVQSIP
jgi:hypothetical protein